MQFYINYLMIVLVLFLAVSDVFAAPLKHHRRKACKQRPSTTLSSSSTSSAKPTSTIAATNNEIVKTTSSHKSSSASSAKATPSASHTNPTTPVSLLSLFPLGQQSKSWSTSAKVSKPLSLNDATFGTFSNMNALQHPTVQAPDGVESIEATYPKGSAALTGKDAPIGGFSFYATAGGDNTLDITTAKEVTLGYSVLFEDGFDFNLGGKLPGVFGGDSQEIAKDCSGGRRDSRCWSARYMWRTGGKGEGYFYLPPISDFPANEKQCHIAPQSDCNDVYGASVGRGAFNFVAGKRSFISQRVLLNDVGQSNGEIEIFHDGESVISLKGVVLRDSEEGKFQGIQMQTFFGGHAENPWGSPKLQHSYLGDFSLAITQTL